MTRIVQQFLEFAGRSSSDNTKTGVDAFIAEQFASPEDGDEPLFALSLEAGDTFRLPRTFIDRLMTNLVDNALEHGEPPVEIRTARQGDDWLIEVRDHGPGIPDERLDDVLRPFVRLDPARSGNGHCGLGLTIVERLAREQRGRCEIGNAEGGGLIVRIVIPCEET
jgi:two-component system osmolarity sensor histidine kinase EnvZ